MTLPDWMVRDVLRPTLDNSSHPRTPGVTMNYIDGKIEGNDWGSNEAVLEWNTGRDDILVRGYVPHGKGYRLIVTEHSLSKTLASMAASKHGRKAMLKALTDANNNN